MALVPGGGNRRATRHGVATTGQTAVDSTACNCRHGRNERRQGRRIIAFQTSAIRIIIIITMGNIQTNKKVTKSDVLVDLSLVFVSIVTASSLVVCETASNHQAAATDTSTSHAYHATLRNDLVGTLEISCGYTLPMTCNAEATDCCERNMFFLCVTSMAATRDPFHTPCAHKSPQEQIVVVFRMRLRFLREWIEIFIYKRNIRIVILVVSLVFRFRKCPCQ